VKDNNLGRIVRSYKDSNYSGGWLSRVVGGLTCWGGVR
jgi:hypothetical protein